jgi:hypothetical protein
VLLAGREVGEGAKSGGEERICHEREQEIRKVWRDTYKSFSDLKSRVQTLGERLCQLHLCFAVAIEVCAGSVSRQVARAGIEGGKNLGEQLSESKHTVGGRESCKRIEVAVDRDGVCAGKSEEAGRERRDIWASAT